MIGALLRVRFRALFNGLTSQVRKKGKGNKGMMILLALLYLYLLAVIFGMTGYLFYMLAKPYHTAGLDWLYFAMAGLMGLAMAVLGSVFTTQNQIYDAKDNDALLSMPISPALILLSRIIPLLALNLLFAGVVILPAIVVYAVFVRLSPLGILLQLLGLIGIALLAQAIACVFGWLLHLLLSKMNKSLASLLYMVVFLSVYFFVYSKANTIMNSLAMNAQGIADTLSAWVWPLCAMGRGCLGQLPYLAAFLAISCGVFALAWLWLSSRFLRTATASGRSTKREKESWKSAVVHSPRRAVVGKECRKFLGSPVYLTNMGLGVLLLVAMPVAGLIFRGKLMPLLSMLSLSGGELCLIITAAVITLLSTAAISTPSVSLEGANIWVMKSMPLTGADILRGKLSFHCLLTVPTSALAALVLCICFDCGVLHALLSAVACAVTAFLSGVAGLLAGLKWARLEYLNEAYPCKQSMSVAVTLFGIMGIPLLFGGLYVITRHYISPTLFLFLCSACLASISYGFYRLMLSWGVAKWNSL